jgi:2-oxoisovalerate dehydrogenase E1 component
MLNFASLHRLPLVIVIQDNGWAISVPVSEQTAGGTISTMAKGYEGLDVHEIDGTDFVATTMVMEAACARARAGSGPSLIVAHVPRLGPHSSSDDPKKYQTDTVRAECVAADPVPRFKAWLIQQGILDAAEIEFIERRISVEVEEAAVLAEATDRPSPDTADQHVFQASPVTETPSQTEGESIVLMDAIAHAITEEMEDDPKVIVFGQDVAHGKGGVFGITRGLTETFGPHRCFNTPLAESTIIGLAIGLSATGRFKPIAEIQFVDYSWTGMNQIVNELASYHYRSKGQWRCPVVIRMPYGGYIQGGPYHSQSIEAIFAHCPGLKIVIPSNAADAKRLFKAALRDPNPVIFLEHKALYRQRLFSARPEPDRFALLPLGKAAVIREGTDLTYVGWGMTALMGYEAAEALAKEGISIEVIDLRTIVPLDEATILSSVKKTGKLLVAHEAPKNCGVGAEIVARLSEAAFSYLDAPPQRIASLNCPVPYSKELEDAVLPQKETILSAMRELASY